MTVKDKEIIIAAIAAAINSLPSDSITETVKASTRQSEDKASGKIEMLTVNEAAEFTSLSTFTIRQLVVQNKVDYIRCGAGKRGKILISKESLQKLLLSQSFL